MVLSFARCFGVSKPIDKLTFSTIFREKPNHHEKSTLRLDHALPKPAAHPLFTRHAGGPSKVPFAPVGEAHSRFRLYFGALRLRARLRTECCPDSAIDNVEAIYEMV